MSNPQREGTKPIAMANENRALRDCPTSIVRHPHCPFGLCRLNICLLLSFLRGLLLGLNPLDNERIELLWNARHPYEFATHCFLLRCHTHRQTAHWKPGHRCGIRACGSFFRRSRGFTILRIDRLDRTGDHAPSERFPPTRGGFEPIASRRVGDQVDSP